MSTTNVGAIRFDATKKARITEIEERGAMMGVQGAAEFLGIEPATVRGLIMRKEIPSYKYFRNVVFFENELKRYRDFIMIRN